MPSEIDALINQINKKQQENILVRGSDLRHITYQRVTTGSLAFDLMLGGGWPLNCWNEVIGSESHGKTTMVLKTIAANEALNPNYHTLWVAAEEFDPEWAAVLGVNLDNFTFVLTNVMENAYDAVLAILEERAVDAVVIDSYPALVPSEEDDKNMMELTVGRGAYMTNKFMRKSMAVQRRSLTEPDRPCLSILINQWRERIGVMFGDPRTTPGGKGKNYRFLTRVEVAREEWISDTAKRKVGQVIKARTLKNKTAPPNAPPRCRSTSMTTKTIPKGAMTPCIRFFPLPSSGTSLSRRVPGTTLAIRSGRVRSRCSPHSRLIPCYFAPSVPRSVTSCSVSHCPPKRLLASGVVSHDRECPSL